MTLDIIIQIYNFLYIMYCFSLTSVPLHFHCLLAMMVKILTISTSQCNRLGGVSTQKVMYSCHVGNVMVYKSKQVISHNVYNILINNIINQ